MSYVSSINCPECNHSFNVNDWFDKFAKTTDGLYYFTCPTCKIRLGSTLMINGDLTIWNKKNEAKPI